MSLYESSMLYMSGSFVPSGTFTQFDIAGISYTLIRKDQNVIQV